MANLHDWSTTPADNADSDVGMTWVENQPPSTVNDSARQLMARIAEWRDDLAGSIVTGGTGNAYTVTSSMTIGASYPDGLTVCFTANRANGGSSTLSVNGGPAVAMRHKSSTALPPNSIVNGGQYVARFATAGNEFIVSGTRADIIEVAPSLLSAQVFGLRVGDPTISFAPTPNPGFIRLTESVQAISKASYPDLNACISGWGYPWGSSSTTFNLPPAAGYFPRFAGTSTAVDPDGPRVAGSIQADAFKSHTHVPSMSAAGGHAHINPFGADGTAGFNVSGPNGVTTSGASLTSSVGDHVHALTIANTGGDETRGKNVALHLDILASPPLVAAGLIGTVGYSYRYSTSTTAADPGMGFLRFNNADLVSATALYISEFDGYGSDLANSLASWVASTSTVKGRLRLVKVGAPASFVEYDITARTDGGGWNTFTIAYQGLGGSLTNGDAVHVLFVPKGDSGGGGGGGSGDVVGPSSAVNGHVALFDGTTGKTIKDGGALGTAAFQPTTAFDAVGVASTLLAAHTAASNPHSQYVRTVNGTGPDGAGNVTVSGGGGSGDVVGPASAVADMFAAYNGTTGKLIKDSGFSSASFDAAGASAAAIAAHIAASDPHTQYALEARAVLRAMVEGWWITEQAGVVGDNSTDCTAGITSLITSVSAAGGGIVYIPAGIFRVSSLGSIPANVKLIGANRHGSVIRTTSATAIVVQPNGAKIALQNFTIDSAVTRSAGAFIDVSASVSELEVENMTLRGAFVGIQINNGGAIYKFDDIDIEDTVATSGVSFRVLGGFLVYVNDLICRNGIGARPYAHMEVVRVEDMLVCNSQLLSANNNLVIAPGSGQQVALFASYSTMYDDCPGSSVRIVPGAGGAVNGVSIYSPWIKGSPDVLATTVGGGTINGLTIADTDLVGTTTGIDATGVTNLRISGVRAGSKSVVAVALTNCTDFTIEDNRLGPWGPYSGNAIGVYLGGTTDNGVVTGNNLRGNTTAYLNGGSGTNVVQALNLGVTSAFVGDGSGLTGIAASQWTNQTGGISYASKVRVGSAGGAVAQLDVNYDPGTNSYTELGRFTIARGGSPVALRIRGSVNAGDFRIENVNASDNSQDSRPSIQLQHYQGAQLCYSGVVIGQFGPTTAYGTAIGEGAIATTGDFVVFHNGVATTGFTSVKFRAGAADTASSHLLRGYLSDGTTEKWYITRDGGASFGDSVGIKNTSPVVPLDVDGPVRIKTYTTLALLTAAYAASLGKGITAYIEDGDTGANGAAAAGGGSTFRTVVSNGTTYVYG